MKSFESSMGGAPDFRTTIWSDILAAGDPTHPQTRQRLDQLLRRYWKPVCAYIRLSWNASPEDSRDLTQAFFTMMLEKEYWSRLSPEKGSFRGYLRQALKHFLINARKHDASRKPDGPLFSLDAAPEEVARIVPVSPGETPEQAYDRMWFRCLMEDATAALKVELEKEDKKVYFDVFSAYCFGGRAGLPGPPVSTPTHRELGERFGIKETAVNNYLNFCRQKLQRIVRDSIRDYVTTPDELDRELREAAGG